MQSLRCQATPEFLRLGLAPTAPVSRTAAANCSGGKGTSLRAAAALCHLQSSPYYEHTLPDTAHYQMECGSSQPAVEGDSAAQHHDQQHAPSGCSFPAIDGARAMGRTGTSLLAAGYCLYSSSTLFVLTVGKGSHGFTYDAAVGEFILSHPNMKVPDADGQKIYSFNEGNYQVPPPFPP